MSFGSLGLVLLSPLASAGAGPSGRPMNPESYPGCGILDGKIRPRVWIIGVLCVPKMAGKAPSEDHCSTASMLD